MKKNLSQGFFPYRDLLIVPKPHRTGCQCVCMSHSQGITLHLGDNINICAGIFRTSRNKIWHHDWDFFYSKVVKTNKKHGSCKHCHWLCIKRKHSSIKNTILNTLHETAQIKPQNVLKRFCEVAPEHRALPLHWTSWLWFADKHSKADCNRFGLWTKEGANGFIRPVGTGLPF